MKKLGIVFWLWSVCTVHQPVKITTSWCADAPQDFDELQRSLCWFQIQCGIIPKWFQAALAERVEIRFNSTPFCTQKWRGEIQRSQCHDPTNKFWSWNQRTAVTSWRENIQNSCSAKTNRIQNICLRLFPPIAWKMSNLCKKISSLCWNGLFHLTQLSKEC